MPSDAEKLLVALQQLRVLKRELSPPDEVAAMFANLSPEEQVEFLVDLQNLRTVCLDTLARIEEHIEPPKKRGRWKR